MTDNEFERINDLKNQIKEHRGNLSNLACMILEIQEGKHGDGFAIKINETPVAILTKVEAVELINNLIQKYQHELEILRNKYNDIRIDFGE